MKELKEGVYVKCLNNMFFEVEPPECSHTLVIVKVLRYYFGYDKDYTFEDLFKWCKENIQCSRIYNIDEVIIDDWHKDSGLTSFECEEAIKIYLDIE